MTTYAAETADPETSDLKPLELYQIDESYGEDIYLPVEVVTC
jgi:hypothetical protein